MVRFRRFHLGRNGAVHGGAVAQMWDSVLGFAAFRLTRSLKQRTAYLHVNYRQIVPIDKELQVDARIDRAEGRKIFVTGRLLDGDAVLCRRRSAVREAQPGPAVTDDGARRRRLRQALGALARSAARNGPRPSSATASWSEWSGWRSSAVGIVAIPYPGPGWAIVFVGLGILATEFDWARRLLAYAKERYDKVMDWFHRQGRFVQILGGVLTRADRRRDAVAARRAGLDR